MSLQEQFEMSRIPIKPLPYENHDLAQKAEFMIDYTGSDPNYHLYIVDPSDETRIIDITANMVREAFGSSVNIYLDGREEPMTLNDLLNFIYSRFVYPNNLNGFTFAVDKDKLTSAKVVLLQDTDGSYYIPVMRADAIYDKNGQTIEDRLNSLTRVGFASDYITAGTNDQNVFDINYPFMNYSLGGNYMELRAGTVVLDKTRYSIVDKTDEDGNVYGCTVRFFNDYFEEGRRIDIMYIYNATDVSDQYNNAVAGQQIANKSIPTCKLEKVSDNFTIPDSDSVATSKALYDMYLELAELIGSENKQAVFVVDGAEGHPDQIQANLSAGNINLGNNYILLSVLTQSPKHGSTRLRIIQANASVKDFNISIPSGTATNKLIKFLVNKNTCKVINVSSLHINRNRYIYTALDQEIYVSFSDLSYNTNSNILVYRNGLRLFKDLDYSINMQLQTITLFTRTEEGERIVFEAETIEY